MIIKNILEKIEFIKAKFYFKILGRSLVFYTPISSGERIKLKLIKKKVIEISEKDYNTYISSEEGKRMIKYFKDNEVQIDII